MISFTGSICSRFLSGRRDFLLDLLAICFRLDEVGLAKLPSPCFVENESADLGDAGGAWWTLHPGEAAPKEASNKKLNPDS